MKEKSEPKFTLKGPLSFEQRRDLLEKNIAFWEAQLKKAEARRQNPEPENVGTEGAILDGMNLTTLFDVPEIPPGAYEIAQLKLHIAEQRRVLARLIKQMGN